MEPKYNLIKEHPWHGNPELSGLLLMGYANEHHEWPTLKITPKPWGSGAINFHKCFSLGCGYLTLDAAQSYIHVFCEPPTAEIKIRHGYFWVWGNCTYDLENWNWGKYHKILKRGTECCDPSFWCVNVKTTVRTKDLEAVFIMVPWKQLINFKWSGTSRGSGERSPSKHFGLGKTFSIHIRGTHFDCKII